MNNLEAVLFIAQIPGLRTKERFLLCEPLKRLNGFRELSKNRLESIIHRKFQGFWEPGLWETAGVGVQESCKTRGIGILSIDDAKYPPQLREIFDPPVCLFYLGKLPDNNSPMVGMVGTRYPSARGRRAAFQMGLYFGNKRVGVVSGLARGIDIASHQGNMVGGGATAAVLAGGLDRVYPRAHENDAEEILLSGGILFSEYPPGTPPQKFHFPARNRIISGLSRSVIVVEAPDHSGALITADFAAEQGRDLFVHSVNLSSSCGEGGRRLAADGASVIENAEEILVEWWGKSLSFEKEGISSKKNHVREPAACFINERHRDESILFQGEYFRSIR